MVPARWMRAAVALFLMGASAGAFAQTEVAVPPLASRVTDLTATLSPDQVAALEKNLADFEAKKGSQIAVLLVPTTQPETIEQYSIRVADAWKIGRAGIGDGAIVLVAKDDRRVRIEVGRGLEGAVPDAYAKRIIAETITPRFREGDFYAGIDAGTKALMRLVEGEPLPAPQARERGGAEGDLESLFVILLVVVVVLGGVLRGIFGRFLGSVGTGGVAGAIAWFIAGTLIAGIGAGLLAFFLSLLLSGSRGGFARTHHRGGSIVIPGGGWGGGGGGWSNGGGGGWSGGGGDFGGGGASGSW